jgi:hypothetical protein
MSALSSLSVTRQERFENNLKIKLSGQRQIWDRGSVGFSEMFGSKRINHTKSKEEIPYSLPSIAVFFERRAA